MLILRRVYDPAPPGGEGGFLVERLWPRGVKKETLGSAAWLKDAAPSDALRRWFGHDPAKWSEFRKRYYAELDANGAALEPLLDAAKRGDVVLLYSSRDTEHNNALALKQYLEKRLAAK